MLQALEISGEVIGIDVLKYSSDISNPFIYNEELQTNYRDISSIINWYKYGTKTTKDYKFIFEKIYDLIIDITGEDYSTIDNLTSDEGKIASELGIVPSSYRDNYYSELEQIYNAEKIIEKLRQARGCRFEYAKSYFHNNLSKLQCQNIIVNLKHVNVDNNTLDVVDNYVNYGIEGTEVGHEEGIYDFIQSTVGSSFETIGLSSLNTDTYSGTTEELITNIMEIIKDGNYTKF
jgi:hypothetical protein